MRPSQSVHIGQMSVVVMGSPGVGKTSLLLTVSTNSFPRDHIPTLYDKLEVDVQVDSKLVHLELWDTSLHLNFDDKKPIPPSGTGVFIVCFSLLDPKSLEEARLRWIPQIRYNHPQTPILLVGTKLDLAGQTEEVRKARQMGKGVVTFRQAHEVAERLGLHYYACSNLENIGLRNILDEAVRAVIKSQDTSRQRSSASGKGNPLLRYVVKRSKSLQYLNCAG